MPPVNRTTLTTTLTTPLARLHRTVRCALPSCRSIVVALAAVAGAGVVVAVPALTPASALDNTPWTLPAPPPRCTADQANAGDVAGCIVAFYDDPSATGWGVPPAPGVGEGWTWSGYRYNGSAALAGWESTWIDANTDAVGGLRAGTLETHAYARALFEGFLNEISANGYRVREASGYSFRCTAGSGGWNCPSGDPDDLSNHAWGLAIDFNSARQPDPQLLRRRRADRMPHADRHRPARGGSSRPPRSGASTGAGTAGTPAAQRSTRSAPSCRATHRTSSSVAHPSRPPRSPHSTSATTRTRSAVPS